MRITAGSLRGRNVPVPSSRGLRPTPAKVRQALFNILGDIHGWHMLDLYAGSGIMALEALSRGASMAISLEQQHIACKAMKNINRQLALANWHIQQGSLPQILTRHHATSFDLVFADPPYEQGIAEQIPLWLEKQQIHCQHLVIEESSHAKPIWPKHWQCAQTRQYGDSCLHFLNPMIVEEQA